MCTCVRIVRTADEIDDGSSVYAYIIACV
jgi:hypothetical protein